MILARQYGRKDHRRCGRNVMIVSYQEPDSVLGRPAHVTVAIPGGARPGEVLVRVRGGSESYIAYADEPVDEGVQVVVVADRGARSLVVVPL
jgi:membrane protein implicated in regulation of membrane protease activity